MSSSQKPKKKKGGFKKLTLRRTKSKASAEAEDGSRPAVRPASYSAGSMLEARAESDEAAALRQTAPDEGRKKAHTLASPAPRRLSMSLDGEAVSAVSRSSFHGDKRQQKREKQEEKRMKEATRQMQYGDDIAKGDDQYVWKPDLTDEENSHQQRIFEGEKKLQAALRRLHHDKEMIAKDQELLRKTQPRVEEAAVTGYLARFTHKLHRSKARNPKTVSEASDESAAEVTSSAGLKPREEAKEEALKRPIHNVSSEYLETYSVLTPQMARKRRQERSEAEKTVNEKSHNDSYLSRFLEDREESTPKNKSHNDSYLSRFLEDRDDSSTPKKTSQKHKRHNSDEGVEPVMAAPQVMALRNESARGNRRRSSSFNQLSEMRKEADKAEERRKLEMQEELRREEAKLEELRRPLHTSAASLVLTSVLDSSDVDESSSTFESDESDSVDEAEVAVVASGKKKSASSLLQKAVKSPSTPTEFVPIANRRVTEDEVASIIKMGPELGKGAFSLVYQATQLKDGLEVAVKVVDLTRLTPKQLAELDAERFILQQVRHPHVVNLLDIFETATRLYYVLELLPGGDLFNKILQKGCFSERATRRIVRQIVEAVAHMHAMGIVHRDLKPENILVMEDPKTKQVDVKVADFGIAKKIGTRGRAKSTCGSPGYVAPEVIRGDEYDMSVDMFSLGAIVYVLLAGYPPFWGDDMEAIIAKNLNVDFGFNDMYWAHISEPAKQFIRALITKDPEARLTADQALLADFLTPKKKK